MRSWIAHHTEAIHLSIDRLASDGGDGEPGPFLWSTIPRAFSDCVVIAVPFSRPILSSPRNADIPRIIGDLPHGHSIFEIQIR